MNKNYLSTDKHVPVEFSIGTTLFLRRENDMAFWLVIVD